MLHEGKTVKIRYGRLGKTCNIYLLPTVIVHPLAYSWAARWITAHWLRFFVSIEFGEEQL